MTTENLAVPAEEIKEDIRYVKVEEVLRSFLVAQMRAGKSLEEVKRYAEENAKSDVSKDERTAIDWINENEERFETLKRMMRLITLALE